MKLKKEYYFYICFVILTVFDFLTTNYVIQTGIGFEGNQFIAGVVSNLMIFSMIKIIGVLIIIGMIKVISQKSEKAASITQCIIICMMLFVCLNNSIVIASAESGSLILSDSTVENYLVTNVGGGSLINLSQINYDSANINHLESFHIHNISGFVYSYESTPFSLQSPNSGTGLAHYDSSDGAYYVVFSADCVFTSNPVKLTYANPKIISNFSQTGGITGVSLRTQKLCFASGVDTNYCAGHQYQAYHSVTTGVYGVDSWNVSYPLTGYFSVNITKNNALDSKYKIEDIDGDLYSTETTFNKINITNALFIYNQGIVLNATLASGLYDKVFVNLSVAEVAYGTGNITLQYDHYYINENPKIFFNLSDIDLSTWVYHVDLEDPSGIVRESKLINNSGNFTSGLEFDTVGVWTTKLYACGYGICSVNRKEIASATTQIFGSTSGTNYIFFSKKTYDSSELAKITYQVNDDNWTEWFSSYSVDIIDSQSKIVWTETISIQNSSYEIPLSVGVYYTKLMKYYPCWSLICSEVLSQDSTTVFKNIINQNNTDTSTAGYGLKMTISQDCWENVKGVAYTPNPVPANTVVEIYNASNISIYVLPITSPIQSFSVGFKNQTGIMRVELKNLTKIHDRQTFKLYSCVVPTPPIQPVSPEEQQSSDFWLGLVSLMGQGTGEQAKMLFAIIIITIITAIGFKLVGSTALILSFGCYIWFTFINFIPKWIFILVVIILAIASRMFR